MATVDDVEVANASFPNVRQDLNNILEAIATNFSADDEPTTTYPNQWWYETDTNKLYIRNEADDAWIHVLTLDQSTDTVASVEGVSADAISEGNSSVEVVDTGTGFIQFNVDGAEVARFNSDGRLLIGTTTVAPGSTEGVIIYEDGRVFATSDGSYAGYFNRLTSDGDIAIFRKDGSTVGSVGTAGNDAYIGTGDTGLRFRDADDEIWPIDTSNQTTRDAAISLGGDSQRFKDLYLSGGVYLGGTASANELNTYEEGTWTPEFASDSGTDPTCTYDNIQFGYYQRVGDWVHCTGGLRTDSASGGTSNLAIKGLPFAGESTTITGTTCRQAGTLGQVYDWGGNAPSAVYIFEGLTKLFLHKRSSTSALSDQTQIPIGNLVNGTNKNGIHFSITYKIN